MITNSIGYVIIKIINLQFTLENSTFQNLKGLGQDGYTIADDLIVNDQNYQSDLSLIAFENTYITNFEYLNIYLINITMKGNEFERDYSYHPYIFAPDIGTYVVLI